MPCDEQRWSFHKSAVKGVAQIDRGPFRIHAAEVAQAREAVVHVLAGDVQPLERLGRSRFERLNGMIRRIQVRWTCVSMKPGLTVRSERSITRAPGGRSTERSIL